MPKQAFYSIPVLQSSFLKSVWTK